MNFEMVTFAESSVLVLRVSFRLLIEFSKSWHCKLDGPLFYDLRRDGIWSQFCFPVLLNFTMCPPASPSLGNLRSNCTDEELILSLEGMIQGFQLPGNVLTDINPFAYSPQNLPDGFWYFIYTEENKDNEVGFWKTRGKASKIFSNSAITGWRTTFDFYEGQASHGHKTGWGIHEYSILQRGQCEDSKPKEVSSLSRVFLDVERSANQEVQQKLIGAEIARENHLRLTTSVVAGSNTGQSSTSKRQVNEEDSTGRLALIERVPDPWPENLPEIDFLSEGDYLELLDLDIPASHSSSSENSSCLTMSSDECFDSLALLQDIEREHNQKNAGCKFSVSASLKPSEVVMLPAASGSLVGGRRNMSPPEKILKTDSSIRKSAARHQVLDNGILKDNNRNKKPKFRNEGPSSSRKVSASFDTHIASPEGENTSADERKKKFKKYLCFLPF